MTATISEAHSIPHPNDQEGLDAALRWVGEFERTHGRKLRVLHIGNIANNAYNNARIQREFGIEADVLSYDYYHVMACPEWEDAEFTGEIGDPFFPDWWATSLRGWKRPAWFANGPVEMALRYLRLRRSGPAAATKLFWRALQAEVWRDTLRRRGARSHGISPLPRRLSLASQLAQGFDLRRQGRQPRKLSTIAFAIPKLLYGLWFHYLVRPALKRERESGGLRKAAGLHHRLWAARWMALGQDPTATRLPAELLSRPHPLAAAAAELAAFLRDVLLSLLAAALGWSRPLAQPKSPPEVLERRDAHLACTRDRILALHAAVPHATLEALDGYISEHAPRFLDVMREYDIVQGYSIDGFIPMVNGIDRYVCYEHGTLRDLPFEDSLAGIVCRESYLAAPWSLVTNSDVLPSVTRLGLDPQRVVNLPHAFNDAKLRRFRAAHTELRPPQGPPILFSPTRHHWNDRSGSWTKGNDIMLRAAGRLAREGAEFRLVLVEWGQDVAASKEMIADLGLADRVVWVAPMQKRELWIRYCTSHAVLDQFTLPALGGVGFETMALGRRLITALDRAQCDTFYGMAPPCLDARTEEECAARIRQVMADQEDASRLGQAASRWIEDYHSARLIVARQAAVYRELMGGNKGRSSA